MKGLFIICFLVFLGGVKAQDTLLLLSGNELIGSVLEEESGVIKYTIQKKKKSKTIEIERYRVFSITSEGEEKVIYEQDTMIGNYFSEQEMRMFIYGERDALNNHNVTPFYIGSMVAGYGVVTYDLYKESNKEFFGEGPSVVSLAVPLAAVIVAAIPRITIKLSNVSDKKYLANDTYIDGYERTARSRKVMAALKGSAIGVGLGLLTGLAVSLVK